MDRSGSQDSIAYATSFPQQGTVDWGTLASKFVSYSIEVLSRLSAANIQPLTIEIGSLACCQFNISSTGRTNVCQALKSLALHKSFGDALWFGFGIRHIVHNLATTDSGFACLAICAALSEFYPENVAAEILNELAKSLDAPSRLTPSILQWAALLKSCAGVFAAAEFGTLIEFLQRNAKSLYTGEGNFEPDYESYVWAMPESTAEALRGIGSVSRGDMVSITIIGGRDIFWLAAVCQWLLSLRIQIQSTEGVEIYSESGDEDPQVTFILQYKPVPGTRSAPCPSSLQNIRKTYILQSIRDLCKNRYPNHVISGRASWGCIFGSVFGQDFENLVENQEQTVGVAVGSAARILLGIVSAEEELPKNIINRWPTYQSTSFGQGFIDHFISRFPEFSKMKKIMQSATRTSFQDAKVAYENQIKTLTLHCGCPKCNQKSKKEPYERFCRLIIFETIMSLAYSLSEVEVAPNLFPKTASIRARYQRQGSFRSTLSRLILEKDETEDPDWYEELGPFSIVVGDTFNQTSDHRMSRCLELFSGSMVPRETTSTLAASDSGICCYWSVLSGGPSDDPDECQIIHVLPGGIEHNDKPFSIICDGESGKYQTPGSSIQRVTSYTQCTTYITENLEGLKVHFLLTATDDPALHPLKILPTELMDAISQSKGWVKCTNTDCETVSDLPEGNNVNITFLGNTVQVIRSNRLARCAALILAHVEGCVCLLRNEECLQCCLKTGAGGNLMKHYIWRTSIHIEVVVGNRSDKLLIVSSPD